MRRACIYARVSTEEQATDGTSLDSQIEAMRSWAAENGYEVGDDYVLREEWSGAVLERPVLEKVKQLAHEGKIDALLVYAWDRLSRDMTHQYVLRYLLEERSGVKLVSITQPEGEGMMAKAGQGLMAIVAEIERELIRERTMRGRRQRALAGKLIGGYFLYGTTYDQETGKRKKDAQTWPTLFLIFRLVASGQSLGEVAEHLHSLAIPAPAGGSTWHLSTLSRIIRNRAYIGESFSFMYQRGEPASRRKPLSEVRYRKAKTGLRPRDQWIAMPDATPCLIPPDLFEAAQEGLSTRAARYGGATHDYLLGGKARCACGARMHGTACVGYLYYRCSGTKRGLCDARLVRADQLEPLVWREVKAVLLRPEMILTAIEARREGETANEWERDAIAQRLARLDMEERRLYRLYASGTYDQKMLDDELDRIGTERGGLGSRLEEIEGSLKARDEMVERGAEIAEYCRRASQNIETFGLEEKALALDALGVKVLVDGKRVGLSGVIPLDYDLLSVRGGWRWVL